MHDLMLKEEEAASLLGVSPKWLERVRGQGNKEGPAYHKIGRCVRYRRSELEAFLVEHRVPGKVGCLWCLEEAL